MQIPEQGEFGFAWKIENCCAMCHCLTAAVETRGLTDSLPRQSSNSASDVLKITPRHCLRNAGKPGEIRESIAALLKQWHEDGVTKPISSSLRFHQASRARGQLNFDHPSMNRLPLIDTSMGSMECENNSN